MLARNLKSNATKLWVVTLTCWLASASHALIAQVVPTSGKELKVETLLDQLSFPMSVAIKPGTGDIFVAESGAGRIIHLSKGKSVPVIVDFPLGKFDICKEDSDAGRVSGPASLCFASKSRLLVGTAGLQARKEKIYLFDLESLPEDGPAKATEALFARELNDDDDENEKGFTSLTMVGEFVFTNCFQGEPGKSWIARSAMRNDKFVLFRRFASLEKNEADFGPVSAIAKSPEGHLLAGHMGKTGRQGDSSLRFLEAQHGKALIRFPLDPIRDVIAFAYGPQGSKLYALDFDQSQPQGGGLFQLVTDSRGNGCKAVKVLDLASPTSMAFAKDGSLFVTLSGAGKKNGSLIRIVGLSQSSEPADQK